MTYPALRHFPHQAHEAEIASSACFMAPAAGFGMAISVPGGPDKRRKARSVLSLQAITELGRFVRGPWKAMNKASALVRSAITFSTIGAPRAYVGTATHKRHRKTSHKVALIRINTRVNSSRFVIQAG